MCAKRKMNAEVAHLFAAAAPAEVALPDCHQLDAAAMTELIKECITPR